jgi:SHS2 domain-containing protein
MLPFEEIEHTADLALRVRGTDLAQLLQHAAQGMLHLTAARTLPGQGKRLRVDLQAPDREQLLVMWLEELLYHMEMRSVAFSEFEIQVLEGLHLKAGMTEHEIESIGKHIKAVTFHKLQVISGPEGLEATVVFDV